MGCVSHKVGSGRTVTEPIVIYVQRGDARSVSVSSSSECEPTDHRGGDKPSAPVNVTLAAGCVIKFLKNLCASRRDGRHTANGESGYRPHSQLLKVRAHMNSPSQSANGPRMPSSHTLGRAGRRQAVMRRSWR